MKKPGMELEKASIQSAQTLWNRLSEIQKAEYMVLVYRVFLNRYPEYKSVFPKDLESVRDNMTDTMNYMIQHLQEAEKMQVVFDCLGAKHSALNIKVETFPHMVSSQVEALDEFFSGSLPKEDLEHWENTMGFLANGIVQAYPD
jgi:hemoglobin-like flavoprotein